MKKGLLTVLLASLVLVGCQNYDDQFDDLNAQISALKSQVDGLGSLSSQVSSLSGTISGLQSGIAAATAAANAAGASATAAGASADAATAAATANASGIAAATASANAAGASATAAGASADAATAAATANASSIAAATASATAAGASADAATAAATANASSIAAATAAATAAGASADAATAAATAATTAATEAVAAGATNATAIAAATAAATAAGVSAEAATAAANAATAAATAAGTTAAAAASSTDLTALSASLTALAADVAAVQTGIAAASTSAEVAALQAEIDAIELDLANLLTSNNVYATELTVNSAATMASALALGNKVALMNAAVDITDDATISDTDIQTLINRIKTTTKGFRYDSGSATGYAPTFDEMTSATSFDIESAGPVSAKKLAAATVVTLVNTYTSKITSLDLSAMASVTTIASGADGAETDNNLTLSSATNIDLGALTMYNVAGADDALTIGMKKGGTLDIGVLTGTERATALEEPLDLTVSGPGSLSISKIADGDIVVSNVAVLTVSGHYGKLDVNGGVETLTTTDSVELDLAGAVDVVTATLDFKYDWDPSLTTAQAAVSDNLNNIGYLTDIAATGDWVATDLKNLTVTGELLDLYLDESNLETLSINATMHDLTLSGTTDLTSLTIASGSKIGNILVTASNNLTVADFDHTTNLAEKASGTTASTTVNKAVSFEVYDNTALTTVHSTGDDVSTLTVAGNDAMTSVDFSGLIDQGTATSATVRVWDNDLTADSASNTSDGDTNKDAGETTDLGGYDVGTSGMKTLATYLGNIDNDDDNTAFVTFDSLSTEVDTETSGTSTTTLNITGATGYTNGAADTTETPTSTNKATVLAMTPATANTAGGGSDATTMKRGWYVTQKTNPGILKFTVNGAFVPADGYTLTGNQAVDALNIASTANKNLASAAGVILDAKVQGNSLGSVTLIEYANTAETSTGERYTSAQVSVASTNTGSEAGTVWAVGIEDEFTLTIGSNSVTASVGGQSVAGTAIADIEEAIVSAWAAKYGAAGTASLSAIATMADDGDGVIAFTMLQKDSGGFGKPVSFLVSDKSANPTGTDTSSKTAGNIGYKIGVTTSSGDNSTYANATTGLIVTLTSPNSGTLQNSVLSAATTNVVATGGAFAATMTEYTTNYTANTAWTGATSVYGGVSQPRTDVTTAEVSVAPADSNAQAAVMFNRVAWLG